MRRIEKRNGESGSLEIIILVFVILGLGIIYFVAKFFSAGLKAITQLMVFLLLILIILTALVYQDMENLKAGLKQNNNTFFLYEGKRLYTGVTLKPLNNLTLTLDSFDYFTSEEIEELEAKFKNKKYEDILKSNYKVFFFTPEAIKKPLNQTIGAELNEDEMLEVIKSNDPYQLMAEKSQAKYNLSIQILKAEYKNFYGEEDKV
ncbi:MAG TPA: hypothetical protein VJ461_01110, partial [Candidatus Nanoarchaeia archaeon]|nr:hypothetical protein [Candidatus Nanoarchaeia archaeon]